MKSRWTCVLLIILLSGCASAPATATEPAASPSPIPATETATATPIPPTETPVPSPTPLPGTLVLPLETLGKSVPWLALDKNAPPVSNIVGFNTLRPPFNSPTIRQAFAHAIDREVIAGMAAKYGTRNIGPATTLTPPVTLGRDLYNEVGAVFDPQAAKDLLIEAGYTDPSSFPVVTIVVNASGDVRPGARFNMATAMAGMWKEYLGVTVQVEAIGSWKAYGERLRSNPPEMFWLGWAADYNDPDDFLRVIFHSDSEYNSGKFSNDEYDRLVNRARIGDPAARQELYIRAERLLTETEAALIPLYYTVK